MKKEIRKVPFVGTACKVAGHIFVDRSNPRAALQSMEYIKAELVDGISTVIFPEGTRTKTGETNKFKRGAFKIATEMNLPIVPVSISGAFDVFPTTRKYPIPGKLKMVIHKPIMLHEDPEHRDEQIESIRQIVVDGIENN
jgi:1-acyl-sn-glycerol-3-phosphate acyltransferase